MIILGLFLNIYRGLKIPFLSTLSHSLYTMCIFSCRRARLSLKEAFRVIFARNCNDRRRCRVSSSPIILSSSSTLSSISHLSSSFFLSLYLPICLSFFLFRLSLRVRPCNATTLPISSSRDHLLLRPLLGPVRSRPHGKSCHRNSSIRQFLEPFRHDVLTHINSLFHHVLFYVKKISLGRKRARIFIQSFRKPISVERKLERSNSRLQFK